MDKGTYVIIADIPGYISGAPMETIRFADVGRVLEHIRHKSN